MQEKNIAESIEFLAEKIGDLGFRNAIGKEDAMGVGERGVLALESIAEGLGGLSNFAYLDLHTEKLAEAIESAGASIGDAIRYGLEQIAAAIAQEDVK